MNHSPKFTKLSVLTYSAILLGLATAAQALPTNEVETTYYSDAPALIQPDKDQLYRSDNGQQEK